MEAPWTDEEKGALVAAHDSAVNFKRYAFTSPEYWKFLADAVGRPKAEVIEFWSSHGIFKAYHGDTSSGTSTASTSSASPSAASSVAASTSVVSSSATSASVASSIAASTSAASSSATSTSAAFPGAHP